MTARRGLTGARRLSDLTADSGQTAGEPDARAGDDASSSDGSAGGAAGDRQRRLGRRSRQRTLQRRTLTVPVFVADAVRAVGWTRRDAVMLAIDRHSGDCRDGRILPAPAVGRRVTWHVELHRDVWVRVDRLAAARDMSVSATVSTLLGHLFAGVPEAGSIAETAVEAAVPAVSAAAGRRPVSGQTRASASR